VIAAYLYLRIMVSMWLADSSSAKPLELSVASRLALLATVAITTMLGVLPSSILSVAVTVRDVVR